jgi:hypothetical protein
MLHFASENKFFIPRLLFASQITNNQQTGAGMALMRMSLLVWMVLAAGTNSVYAQSGAINDNWYRGSLILADGDSLTGDIHYDLQNNLVQINAGNSIKAYSARQIWSFSFYDPDMMTDRQFFALPYTVESNYKAPVLFELLTEGDVSLLARERLVTENVPQYGYGGFGNSSSLRTRIRRDYFLGFANGNIRSYDGSRKDLLYLLRDKSGEVKKFINAHRFRYDDKRDLVQIINYYNSLKK